MAVDLKAIQKRLNSDEAFRSTFLKEPVKTLAAEGLLLPEAARKELTDFIARLTSEQPPVPGSSLDMGQWGIRLLINNQTGGA